MDAAPLQKINVRTLSLTHATPLQRSGTLPILFVHGAWGGKWQFENWQRYAAERDWESYALDLRGHNESPCEDLSKVSVHDYADDVLQVIREIGPCYLLGHSMGGLVSQIVASQSNEVKKLISLASAPRGTPFVNTYVLHMLTYAPRGLWRGTVVLTPKDTARFFGRIPLEATGRFVPESSRAAIDVAINAFHKITVRCPLMIVAGTYDRLLPVSVQRKLAKRSAAEYAEFPSGHFLMLEENWQDPIASILRWLETP
ncbi:MAG TPA: alpha/beta fold hydrolase [Candidatus Paceibacterota bacterium]|jgi:pimeloyl-ACP methyl ester carboxylesterase|nr:alpha/beta fold hydrolase [Candidatus Paceibacterota bacterium]